MRTSRRSIIACSRSSATGVDTGVISPVLGPLHTLKGNSGMMGFTAIKEYVHRLEDVFAQIVDGGVVLEGSGLRPAVRRGQRPARGHGAGLPREGRGQEPRGREGRPRGDAGRRRSGPRPGGGARGPSRPSRRKGRRPRAKPAAGRSQRPRDARRTQSQYVAPRSNTVRVDFAQLDHLLNLVGELIIYRTKLDQVGKRAVEAAGGRDAGQDLLDAVNHLAGVSQQLQETVMDIRMLPIRHVFERFPRMVRDLARTQGKEIELILEGDGTRVDKAIIDEIGEPLVHLIRNSVDHGIEDPRDAGGARQDADRHDPALGLAGVEPRRDHDHGRRRGHRRRHACGARPPSGACSRATRT